MKLQNLLPAMILATIAALSTSTYKDTSKHYHPRDMK